MKLPKDFKSRNVSVAGIRYWEYVKKGKKICTINHLTLSSKRDFEAFEKWFIKAKTWTLSKEEK